MGDGETDAGLHGGMGCLRKRRVDGIRDTSHIAAKGVGIVHQG